MTEQGTGKEERMPEVIKPVRRVYVEKKPGFNLEAGRLWAELAGFLGTRYPELAAVKRLRILQRYDVSNLEEAQFAQAVGSVFSEPQCDQVFYGVTIPADQDERYFGVEYLPGQYDQRRDSAEQCIELVTGVKPVVKTARIYLLQGNPPLSDATLEGVKRYLINPVDSQEASLEMPPVLDEEPPEPQDVPILEGFSRAGSRELGVLALEYGLAMSGEDLQFCQAYFATLRRDPTLAELRLLDTYWSDHCRHTTFTTTLDDIAVEEGTLTPALKNALTLYASARKTVYGDTAPPPSLMDMATIGAKALKKQGLLDDLDKSQEINACSVKITAEFDDGSCEPWLLLFKNETHNHPTEIEPFGGAATCLGGAIRDPLSGRAFVHHAMRITGSGDPRKPLAETLPGKLPQLKLGREAAAGYSSYGNQIGLATGQVAEFYHSGFIAKRLELGAVIAAVPEDWVRRESPAPGDVVILLGGKTGRDGIGGATGSSKAHTGESVEKSGAEVQKGNPVEERKLQRLFRNPEVIRLIKRCNDFGAGGVSVAVGELAPGLEVNLDRVPKKYAGLDGIELAISESQERMAVVVAPQHAEALIRHAAAENLDGVIIARITAGDDADPETYSPDDPDTGPHLRMTWRGKTIVDLSRQFLNSNGAARSVSATLPAEYATNTPEETPAAALLNTLEQELLSLRSGSRRGLQERFDGSIGAGSVLFPWGGREQGTPECGIAGLLPALVKGSCTASLMTFGYDPNMSSLSPYQGAKGAIREALAKFACLGGNPWKSRLSLQEYFPRPETPETWGKPAAALLGALEAQLKLGVPAIGGKDSMSGTYRDTAQGIDLSVPPTLVAFAAGTAPAAAIRSGALSGELGNLVILLYQTSEKDEWDAFKANMNALIGLNAAGIVKAAYPVGPGGIAATLAVMAFGNGTGLEVKTKTLSLTAVYQGSVLVEIDQEGFSCKGKPILDKAGAWAIAATTIPEPVFCLDAESDSEMRAEVPLHVVRRAYEYPFISVYPQTATGITVVDKTEELAEIEPITYKTEIRRSRYALKTKPLVVLPVFPGTNCEWDMERAFRRAGAQTQLVIFRNRSRQDIQASIEALASTLREAQIVALSGGFSAGDEPDGSGKFIANVFRSPLIIEAVMELLEKRDGLILGICNGFQALIKLGLVPYGEYRQADDAMPTLTFNKIGRHISRMVRTAVISNRSPWLALEPSGAVHVIPVSHGEGRLVIRPEEGRALFKAGQVPFCYVDDQGRPTLGEPDNPNGSDFGIEGLTSPDGRILGKMGHSERCGEYVHINIPGNKHQQIFEAGVRYFS
jgi:phosphoribosylformylglycinamidine synthase